MIIKFTSIYKGIPVGTIMTCEADYGMFCVSNGYAAVENFEGAEKIIPAKVTLTLPATLAAYAAGDVITGIVGSVPKFVDVAKAAGRNVMLVCARLQTSDPAGYGGKTFNLHFYNDRPTTIVDNGAFAIADVDADKREGKVNLAMGAVGSNTVKVGMTDAAMPTIASNPVARDVYFYLETVEGLTPTAISTTILVKTYWLIS